MSLKFFSVVLVFILAACGGNGDTGQTDPGPGPYSLAFHLDDSFKTPHSGDPVRIALVRLSDGIVIAEGFGSVTASESPSFTFTTAAIMEKGKSYAVHYWIDSNIGGGTTGQCDGTEFDHQWSTEFFLVSNDINFTTDHEPGLVEYVCDTFS